MNELINGLITVRSHAWSMRCNYKTTQFNNQKLNEEQVLCTDRQRTKQTTIKVTT